MQSKELPRAQELAERAFANLERFLHIEAVSGILLLIAAVVALIWANSPAAESYEALWHSPLTFGVGSMIYSQSLHFWINDGLMTIFFLVVGMEIRREIHEGALSSLRQAMLPIAAANGGVVVPALIYLGFGHADKMNKIHWFCVSNPDGKRFPEWRRSFGVSDGGVVFVPAAMAGDETEM